MDSLSLAKGELEFRARRAPAMLLIPAGFNALALEQGRAELDLRLQPSSTGALTAQRVLRSVVDRFESAAAIARSRTTAAEPTRPGRPYELTFAEAFAAMGGARSLVSIANASTPEDVEYDPAANSSAGQLITWVFIPLLGIAALFAFERQKGTLRRLLVSPTPKATFLLGTIVGQVATALVQMLLLVVFGAVVMKLPWARNLGALALMLISMALGAASLGTFLGTLVKSEAQANGLSIMIGMVMALLGGCWYPLDLFPRTVQSAVKVLPTTWAMQGLLDVVSRGQGISAVMLPAGVLLGFAAAFFAIGTWRFRAA
jgi:ABC-2 type transport system permease protein